MRCAITKAHVGSSIRSTRYIVRSYNEKFDYRDGDEIERNEMKLDEALQLRIIYT